MMILAGFALVLVTWGLALLVVAGMGFLPAALVSPTHELRVVIRRALWWGVLVAAIASYLINLVEPLRSTPAMLLVLALAAISSLAGAFLHRRGNPSQEGQRKVEQALEDTSRAQRVSFALLRSALVAVVVYLAFAALGPVTNYDSGLYHLGAIQYASEFPTIPGLANIFPALGYGNAEFPLAALMGNGPLGDNGFRTLNGFVMLLLVVDAWLRIRGRRFGAGFFVLVVGVTAAAVPMVALSDYWMTSPSQDSTVMMITIAASVYFVDALESRKSWVSNGSTALALCILLVMLRPTMVVFAAMTLVILAVIAWRRRRTASDQPLGRALLVTALLGALAAVAATARDYVMSGWFQYPLSLHAFQVAWLAPDPAAERLATLGYHRNPDDIWGSLDGWGWVPSWFSRLHSQWETFEFAGLALLAAALILAALLSSPRIALSGRLLLLAVLPSAVALLFWWVATPPSFRFTWGPLFMLPAISIGWLIAQFSRADKSAATVSSRRIVPIVPQLAVSLMALAMILTVVYSAVARLNLSSATETQTVGPITFAVTPPYAPDVQEGTTTGGLTFLRPVSGEQCWAVFPVCTPRLLDSVAPRASGIRDGFLP